MATVDDIRPVLSSRHRSHGNPKTYIHPWRNTTRDPLSADQAARANR